MLTIKQAADRLGLSPSGVWNHIRAGRLPRRKHPGGRDCYLTEADLAALAAVRNPVGRPRVRQKEAPSRSISQQSAAERGTGHKGTKKR